MSTNREFEIRREVDLAATPHEVWDAIATGPGLACWFMPMPMDPDSDMVEAWEPAERLSIRTPAMPDGSTQAFEYLIEARDGGTTVLRFVHSGVMGDDWDDEYEAMTGSGWDQYLFTLAQYFRHFNGRSAVYVEAEAPPSSIAPEARASISAALGLGDAVTLDVPVRIDLDGVGTIDGVVDYATDNFIGVRTPDALIRFHLRGPIGSPVAVSHHAYGRDVDAGSTAKAWEAWLAAAFD